MKDNKSAVTITAESFRVIQKLQPQLALLMGNGGFRALLTRALALAKAEVQWLSLLRVNTDGTLEAPGLEATDEFGTQVTNEEMVEGYSVLLSKLIGLMTAFIGANLTLGLVREVWPKINISSSDFENQGVHENHR